MSVHYLRPSPKKEAPQWAALVAVAAFAYFEFEVLRPTVQKMGREAYVEIMHLSEEMFCMGTAASRAAFCGH